MKLILLPLISLLFLLSGVGAIAVTSEVEQSWSPQLIGPDLIQLEDGVIEEYFSLDGTLRIQKDDQFIWRLEKDTQSLSSLSPRNISIADYPPVAPANPYKYPDVKIFEWDGSPLGKYAIQVSQDGSTEWDTFKVVEGLETYKYYFRLGTGYSTARVTLIEGWVQDGELDATYAEVGGFAFKFFASPSLISGDIFESDLSLLDESFNPNRLKIERTADLYYSVNGAMRKAYRVAWEGDPMALYELELLGENLEWNTFWSAYGGHQIYLLPEEVGIFIVRTRLIGAWRPMVLLPD